MNQYNIVYIHTHDTGRSIEPYDPGVRTPNLMKLAKESVMFRQAYCVGPTCSPSRSGLLTGQYPHENGMLGLAHRGFSLNDYSKHLSHYLKQNGYQTALFGIQHEAADELVIGYDFVYKESPRQGISRAQCDIENAKKAVDYIQKKYNRPFFVSYGLWHTHKPYPQPEEINPDYVKVPDCLPDTPETRLDYAGFLTSAMMSDKCIGTVLQAIKDAGIWENTVVLYTTDHGVALPHMKCTLYDQGIGVAMLLSVPGYRDGKVSDALVSHLDVYPTLCDLIGGEKPEWLRGVSMMPLLRGEQDEVREFVFSEINYHVKYEPQRAFRTKRYKYIRRYVDTTCYDTDNIDPGEAKEFLMSQGLHTWEIANEQLYDLYLDPGERRNLVKDLQYCEVLKQMRLGMEWHMKETRDPLAKHGALGI